MGRCNAFSLRVFLPRRLLAERFTHQQRVVGAKCAEFVGLTNIVRCDRSIDDFKIMPLKKSLRIGGKKPKFTDAGGRCRGFECPDQFAAQSAVTGVFRDDQRPEQACRAESFQADQPNYRLIFPGDQKTAEPARAQIVDGQVGSLQQCPNQIPIVRPGLAHCRRAETVTRQAQLAESPAIGDSPVAAAHLECPANGGAGHE